MKALDWLLQEFNEVAFRKGTQAIQCVTRDDCPAHIRFKGTGKTPEQAAQAVYEQIPWRPEVQK